MNKDLKLEDIYSPVSWELNQVKNEIKRKTDQFTTAPIEADKIIQYFFKASGKGLRPALVALSAKASNNKISSNDKKLVSLAMSAEFIHSASLIHDDIVDESLYRRKQRSLNSKFGNKIAVLAGDAVYTYALKLLTENFDNHITGVYIDCIKKMCHGEIQNLSMKKLTYKRYFELITNKTAELMSACCYTGAIYANGRNRKEIKALKEFGLNFGIAFQLIDDYKDKEAPQFLRKNCLKLAHSYINKALFCLRNIKESIYKSSLQQLADFIIQ